MEEEQVTVHTSFISSSEPSTSSLLLVEQENEQHQQRSFSYLSDVTTPFVMTSSGVNHNACSCIVVLLTFWFFASTTMILGLYGASNLELGPNCSRIITANTFLVKDIKVQLINGPNYGLTLYGFHKPPPLDVETTWLKTHNVSLLSHSHKEWVYFLNKGSEIDITYNVKSPLSVPISLVIAQGKESIIEWIQNPSYPNLTLSWSIIHGSGTIQQKISKSSDYYIAVGNLNTEEVEVQLNLRIRALLYNTSEAYCKCSLAHGVCDFKLFFLEESTAVLTSPGSEKSRISDDWYVKLSYEPRWLSYVAGSGTITVLILLASKLCTKYQPTNQDRAGSQAGEAGSERTPLLAHKDDDVSSWGSSYESVPHDDQEDVQALLAVESPETKSLKDGDNNHPRRLCIICFDAQRDCFFLPCGHCATCFTCGTRIVDEAGTCPICRRKTKKVKKIFTV